MTHTIRNICDHFEVHENTVLGWIASGELRAINVGREPGKKKPRWRISEEALQEFELLRSTEPKRTTKPARRKKAATPSFIK